MEFTLKQILICLVLTFTQMHPSVQSILFQMINVAALSYLVKIRGTDSKVLSDISK